MLSEQSEGFLRGIGRLRVWTEIASSSESSPLWMDSDDGKLLDMVRGTPESGVDGVRASSPVLPREVARFVSTRGTSTLATSLSLRAAGMGRSSGWYLLLARPVSPTAPASKEWLPTLPERACVSDP
jgi:hypothetical protein